MTVNTRVTVTEAAQIAGISRTTMYKSYLNNGVLSKSREDGKVYIERSELARVFPSVKQDDDKNTQVNNESKLLNTIKDLEYRLKTAENANEQASKRESFYQKNIEKQQRTIDNLSLMITHAQKDNSEPPKAPVPPKQLTPEQKKRAIIEKLKPHKRPDETFQECYNRLKKK
jgi:uncharacterized membrane protein YfhO